MDNRHAEPDGQYYPVKGAEPIVNGLLWRSAIQYMFSPRHPDEIFAEILDDATQKRFA
jgi:hypothetical protein